MAWFYLAVAIISEVVATLALKASDGFSDPKFSAICVVGYGVAFYFLSVVVKTIPVGIAYAVWAGVGIVLVAAFGAIWFRQIPDLAAIIGMVLIIAGVVVINLFSGSASH